MDVPSYRSFALSVGFGRSVWRWFRLILLSVRLRRWFWTSFLIYSEKSFTRGSVEWEARPTTFWGITRSKEQGIKIRTFLVKIDQGVHT